MIDKMSMNQRLILAMTLFFLFLIVYDALLPKQETIATETAVSQESTTTASPTVSTNSATPALTVDAKSPSTSVPGQSGSKTLIAQVTLPNTVISIDNLGRISQVELRESFQLDEENHGVQLLAADVVYPLEMRFSDGDINSEAFNISYSANVDKLEVTTTPQTLVLTQVLSNITITKTVTFYPDRHYDIKITTSDAKEYFITPGYRPEAAIDMMADHGLLVQKPDQTLEIIEDGDATGFEIFRDATIVSNFDKYYSRLFYGRKFDVWVIKVIDDDPLAFVKGEQAFSFKGYVGPKIVATLEALDPNLRNVVEYGLFTFIAAPLFTALNWINNYLNNWGWSIILITIIIRLLLFPISAKGMVSMHKLKELAPKMKEIQAKYKGDPQKMQMHTMDLYKKHGANPLGGCLPFLLQIPVFFAIYRVLVNAIELKGTEWFYIADLSQMDPYYILPILMGVSMYFQQKITPNNFTDPMQAKIFQFLPVIFTVMFLTFPAGLVLYWFVNNLLSIAQQFIINKRLDAAKSESDQ
jgi:YidC/Oxa1 family membrane protein insertase